MIRLPRSLQGRLLALVLATVTAVWAFTAALTWLDVRRGIDDLLDGRLTQAAALLLVQQAHEIAEGEHEVHAPTLHRYAPSLAFELFHAGRLVMRSAGSPPLPATMEGFSTVRVGDDEWRLFHARDEATDVHVVVGERTSSRNAIMQAVLRGMLWPIAFALPLLAAVAWWAVRQGVSPLRGLERTLAARRPSALEPVRLDAAPSEIVPVVDALNALFERIRVLLDAERRLTADAAHELRTPIAAIRAQAQVAMNEADDALRRHALMAAVEGCDRATRVVEQLLTLSRLEALGADAMQDVDLCAVARQVVGDLAGAALARRQTIEVDAAGRCMVRADATLLALLLRNLVDNAVRYSPRGAWIRVTVRQSGNEVLLLVEDAGPGMAEADAARLGERFFRVPGSGESGSGLGWSIVRRIAAVHGVRADVARSRELGGLCARVVFAAASAPGLTQQDSFKAAALVK